MIFEHTSHEQLSFAAGESGLPRLSAARMGV